MKSREEMPTEPQTGEAPAPNDPPEPEVKPAVEKVIDPKEAARQRSKDDLARKRRNLKNSRGKF